VTRVLRLALVLGLALLATAAGISPAAAHAQLISSDPADGSVVEAAPAEIVLTFNEPVRLQRARIFAADGAELDVEARSSDSVVTIVPEQDLGEGTIVVSWELASADTHVVSGAISFSVGTPSAGTTTAAAAEAGPAATVVGVLGLLATAVAIGGVVLRRTAVRQGAWLVAVAAAVLWLPLSTGGRLRDWATWLDGALSWRGLLLLGALAGLAGVVSAGRRATLALGAAVLVAAGGGLIAVPGPTAAVPPAGVAAGAGPQELSGELGDGRIDAVVDRAADGRTTLEIQAVDEAGEPVTPVDVPVVRLRSDGLDLGPLVLEEVGAGSWTGTTTVPTTGAWTLEVSVRLSEFENPVASLPFDVAG
jgi:methionine-rich copper-binding protein CopC